MNNLIKWNLSIAMLFLVALTGCSQFKVDQGAEGVIIKKPWFFGHGGVMQEPIKTGLVWGAISSTMIQVDIKPFKIDEKFVDLVTADNNPVDFKVHLTFKSIEGKTPILVEKFGGNWYENSISQPLRNVVRNFTKSHTTFMMTTNSNIIDDLQKLVKEEITALLSKVGVPIELLRVSVGKVLPTQAIIDATIKTAEERQKIKTYAEQKLAEEARAEAEAARGIADKAYVNALGLTTEQYLTMRAIEAAKQGNVSMILGSNAQPMFKVGK